MGCPKSLIYIDGTIFGMRRCGDTDIIPYNESMGRRTFKQSKRTCLNTHPRRLNRGYTLFKREGKDRGAGGGVKKK